MQNQLFNDEISLEQFNNQDTLKIFKDLKNMKSKSVADTTQEASRILASKKASPKEKALIVEARISQVLSKQKNNIITIYNKTDLINYINSAIATGRIDIDTETNNSLDPITCKLMGLCLYYPGAKQAYIPVNHIDVITGDRLPNQLTEGDIAEVLALLLDANIEIIMHNGKFDYEVILCTTGVKIKPTWDTMIGWRLIDENDHASLKSIYTRKIDTSQSKYDLDSLTENVLYEWLNPDIFALYAATDALMTDKVYLLEKEFFSKPENEKLFKLFTQVEMPIVTITGDMELYGVRVDQKLGERLQIKYRNMLTVTDDKINECLIKLKPIIQRWRLTKDATEQSKQFAPEKSSRTVEALEIAYPFIDSKTNKRYVLSKPKTEQLPEDINLASPVQLAILFYDILKCDVVNKKSPRGTGVSELELIKDFFRKKLGSLSEQDLDSICDELIENTSEAELNLEEDSFEDEKKNNSSKVLSKLSKSQTANYKIAIDLCDLILERRKIAKLLTTYIETIPVLAKHWPDGRIRFHLNSLGTDTGRFSSGGKIKYLENGIPTTVSGINIQNIPSRGEGKILRCLFIADTKYNELETTDNTIVIPEYSEVKTVDGWRYPKDLTTDDLIESDEATLKITNIAFDLPSNNFIVTTSVY